MAYACVYINIYRPNYTARARERQGARERDCFMTNTAAFIIRILLRGTIF